jgi:hypothetical protein
MSGSASGLTSGLATWLHPDGLAGDALDPFRHCCMTLIQPPTDRSDALARPRQMGFGLAGNPTYEIALKALSMAVERGRPAPSLIHRSDRGIGHQLCNLRNMGAFLCWFVFIRRSNGCS